MSLVHDVMGISMESSYNSNSYNIEDPIDDTTESVLFASHECMIGMVAIEAAVAKFEGQTAVAILKTNDSYEKQRLVSTYEGFVSDAWEKLKEWIRKAYETVKRWLQKIWTKIKQGADMVKAFFTKYGNVLRQKDTSGLQVMWCKIKIDGGESVRDQALKYIDTKIKDVEDINYGSNGNKAHEHLRTLLDKVHTFRKEMIDAIYIGSKGQEAEETEFDSIKDEALKAADIGSTQKLVAEYMRLGDDGSNDAIKRINDAMKKNNKDNKTTGDEAKDYNNQTNVRRASLNQLYRAKLQVYNISATVSLEAAKRMRAQSIAACRKAIFHNAEESYIPNSNNYSNSMESASTLDSILSSIM